MNTKVLTLQQYHDEVIRMLERQPGDWHVGRPERAMIAECWKAKRPITTPVAQIMRDATR